MMPNTYTEASMASPHDTGVPFGRRFAYGIASKRQDGGQQEREEEGLIPKRKR